MGKKTDQDYEEVQLASYWNMKFKDSMVHKAPYTKLWNEYMDAYNGDYFKNKNLPDYKSDLVSNYIFSTIETIRPIMLDNDPKFQSMPRHPEGMAFSTDLQEGFMYEWDREGMSTKLYRELVTTLVFGTSVWFIPWDGQKKEVKAIPVNPFNVFPDPLATNIDDAEYIIYASYKHVERLKKLFPQKAEKLFGGDINYGELVHDNNKNARTDNQVLVLEVWTNEYEAPQMNDKEEDRTKKYPSGRVVTLCPELGIVLSDKPNPYKDGKFPFELLKDYDIPGKFWGEGEVTQLLSPQKHMNDLNNAILDHAKTTANSPWIVDKNSGIAQGKITSRQGLIIRKNPGSEVKREMPPSMPAYVVNAVETYKSDMEQISGIFDSLKGNSETGVYTAQGILALQEAGQARIRLKVKLMEDFLGRLATKWYARMKQFWNEDRWLRITKPDGSYDFKKFVKEVFDYDYDIRIMAGSTMPVNRGAMLDLMIRLAQTQMPDGNTLVDRQAVIEYLPSEVKSALMKRMGDKQLQIEQQLAELTQMNEALQQQLEQLVQESQGNDEQTFGVIEEITGAIEQINKKILQVQSSHDKLEEEKRRESERNEIKTKSYNEGYTDAENLSNSEMNSDAITEKGFGGMEGLPDDILNGIEDLSDDELGLLLMQNPQLSDLIR